MNKINKGEYSKERIEERDVEECFKQTVERAALFSNKHQLHFMMRKKDK
jgi:hypothetical protein